MKKFVALLMVMVLGMCMLTGCTESDQVSYNISKEANNFNVTRKLTVINARTDVEDISGAEVDKYHYEINFLPEYGFSVTHSD